MGQPMGCMLTLVGLLIAWWLPAQSYFKSLGLPSDSYNIRVAHFANGDVLLADSGVEGRLEEVSGSVIVTRLDNCGHVIWQNSYQRREEYLEFKDFKIDGNGEVYLFGSAFRGFAEMIFLLKISAAGELIKFSLFETETVDRFSYSIDLMGDQIMVYGQLLDFSTKKQGFIAVFDKGLGFRWGKKFTPFDSNGDAIFCQDGGFMCWSGAYYYKFDRDGVLEWARETRTDLGTPLPLAGPVELEDGYVFQVQKNRESVLIMLDRQGEIAWTSPKFASGNRPADLQLLADGNINVMYDWPEGAEHRLGQLVLSPTGEIKSHRSLQVSHAMDSEQVYHSVGPGQMVAVVGNGNLATSNVIDGGDFLLQFSMVKDETSCFQWQPIATETANDYSMQLMPLDTPILETTMTYTDTDITIFRRHDLATYSDLCELPPIPEMIHLDTIIECQASWEVTLPSSDFVWWDDELAGIHRTLRAPGTYTATNRDCIQPVQYEFTLNKPSCECQAFLANAFTPNFDHINDRLELLGSCTLVKMEMEVLDRWGNAIFRTHTPGHYWDGTQEGSNVPEGVYIVRVIYEWSNEVGDLQQGSLVQDVVLLR